MNHEIRRARVELQDAEARRADVLRQMGRPAARLRGIRDEDAPRDLLIARRSEQLATAAYWRAVLEAGVFEGDTISLGGSEWSRQNCVEAEAEASTHAERIADLLAK